MEPSQVDGVLGSSNTKAKYPLWHCAWAPSAVATCNLLS